MKIAGHRSSLSAYLSRDLCSDCAARRAQRCLNLSSRLARSFATSRSARQAIRDGKLPETPARTRFAPSPTGYMHIGGLRTALFSYLLAKRTRGQFILRIEDTDQKRYVPGATERLCDDLQWAGIHWDEGPIVGGDYGPYQQSHRTAIYQEHARRLLDQNSAYRCFCTSQSSKKEDVAYSTSGCYQDCASLGVDEAKDREEHESYTVRLRPTHQPKNQKNPDLIYGNIKRLKRTPGTVANDGEHDDMDASDTILMKSDGTPTYHFANVIDDHLMKITHVIRGTEWMASTPLHYDLYRAFGWEPPLFAHVGLLLDKNKAKLSKRNADVALDLSGLRDEHDILPEALCNFLALLGWSNPNKNDVMDMAELVKSFDLKFTTGNTIVTMDKLWYLQKNHVQRLCRQARETGDARILGRVIDRLVEEAGKRYASEQEKLGSSAFADRCLMILLTDDKSYQTAAQFLDRNSYFFQLDNTEAKAQDVDDAVSNPELDSTLDIMFNQIKMLSKSMNLNATGMQLFKSLEKVNACCHTAFSSAALCQILGIEHEVKILSDLGRKLEVPAIIATIDSESTESTVLKYRALYKACMKRLRDKLCDGHPGPTMGMIIAILGRQEAKKRLATR